METIIMDFLNTADDLNPFHTPFGSPLATASPLVDPIPSSSRSRKKKSAFRYGPRDSLRSRYKIGKPGSRRYRNWENEFFLVKNLSETESEYDSAYSSDWDSSCEPSFGSFALVLEDENREHWDAFIDITEEQQNILLGFYNDDEDDQSSEDESDYEDDSGTLTLPLSVSANEAFTSLRNCTRRTLTRFKDSALLQEIDDTIFSYTNGLLFSLGGIDYLRHDETEDALIFSLPEKFHRLLLHSICEFYDLVSYSIDVTEERQTVVYKRPKTRTRETSLVNYMQGIDTAPSEEE
jgi:hypothetical protein